MGGGGGIYQLLGFVCPDPQMYTDCTYLTALASSVSSQPSTISPLTRH